VATSCDESPKVALSVGRWRATHMHSATTATPPHFRPILSPLSDSRAARVMEELFSLNRSQPLHFHPPCDECQPIDGARSMIPCSLSERQSLGRPIAIVKVEMAKCPSGHVGFVSAAPSIGD
jgi:hypothetical protein